MVHRSVPGMLVVLLAITAGCLGGASLPTAPDAGAGGGDGSDADAPAGDTSSDVTLVENRTVALMQAGSYTSTWRMRATEDGTVVGDMEYTTALDFDAERFHSSTRSTSDGETRTSMEVYYADGASYRRVGDGTEVTYMVSDGEFTPTPPFGREATVGQGDLEEFRVVGTETYDGVQVTRYAADHRVSWLGAQQQAGEDVEWTDFTYEILVDGQGLVRWEGWQGNGVDDRGVTHTIEFTYTLTGVGSTEVSDPAWIADARAQA